MRKRSNFNHFYYNLQIPYHTTDWKTAIWTQIQISCQTYPSGRKTAQETFQTSGRSTSNSYPVHIRMITRWSCYQLTCHKSFSIRSSAHCWHDQCQTGLGIKGFYKRFGKSAFLLKHHSPPAVHRQPLPPPSAFQTPPGQPEACPDQDETLQNPQSEKGLPVDRCAHSSATNDLQDRKLFEFFLMILPKMPAFHPSVSFFDRTLLLNGSISGEHVNRWLLTGSDAQNNSSQPGKFT